MNLELKKAIDQISKDKGLDRDMLIDTLEEAVRTSVLRRFSEDMDVEVTYNDETGDIEVYQFKIVVEDDDVANEDTQIALEDARALDPSVQLDDEMGFKVQIADLGRIAAQSAKQVIIQRMRDAEQEIIYEEYKDRIGEIVSGIAQRPDRRNWIVNLGRTEAILPRDEQIPHEHYKRSERVQAIIIDVRKEGRGPQVVISRAHRDFMAALFKREVPEVDDGVVQIMGVARDPGLRAKVSVMSRERDVDPVGACVGVRGSRIQNIVQELHGERIDIVVWSPDIATYARNALAPAFVSRIVVDDEENLLEVIVPDDQLTLAIGRKGQNVKLAAQLLGWKVDIFTESRYNEANAIGHGLEQVASVAEVSIEALLAAGYSSIAALRQAADDDLRDKLGLSSSRISDLRQAINFLSPIVEDAGAAEQDTEAEMDEAASGPEVESASKQPKACAVEDDGEAAQVAVQSRAAPDDAITENAEAEKPVEETEEFEQPADEPETDGAGSNEPKAKAESADGDDSANKADADDEALEKLPEPAVDGKDAESADEDRQEDGSQAEGEDASGK